MSALAEFQQQFAAALFDPSLHLGAASQPGLSVHRNTVMKGLIDVLSANYPTVERLVGPDCFRAAADEYARRYRPREAAMAFYGDAFADFLSHLPLAVELPYLAEVARLDRLWTETHFAADAAVLTAAELARHAPEKLQHLKLRLHPSLRLVWCAHSAYTIWLFNRPPADVPEEIQVDDAEQGALFLRPAGAVETTGLSRAEHSFLLQLRADRDLGAAAIHVLEQHADADIGAMLARFICAGAFSHIEENKNV